MSNEYRMSISLNVLNHLGLHLYSNTPAVLSEVIANAWDADATSVNVNFDLDAKTITVTDDGHGMDLDDINQKYLYVGFKKKSGWPDSNAIRQAADGMQGHRQALAVLNCQPIRGVQPQRWLLGTVLPDGCRCSHSLLKIELSGAIFQAAKKSSFGQFIRKRNPSLDTPKHSAFRALPSLPQADSRLFPALSHVSVTMPPRPSQPSA